MRPIAEILVEVNAKTTAQLLAEHYQKTYELTYEFWKQRNRTFILLIGVIGVATLLTFRPSDTQPLLLYWIVNVLGVTDVQSIEELRSSFPFGILQSILLIVVFYLMFNLIHSAAPKGKGLRRNECLSHSGALGHWMTFYVCFLSCGFFTRRYRRFTPRRPSELPSRAR